MRFATLFLFIGSCRTDSKTSKMFTISFLSAEEVLKNLSSLKPAIFVQEENNNFPILS